MNLFVHVIFQTTFLGVSALQAASPHSTGSGTNAVHRSPVRGSSVAVLDSAGEAALTVVGEASPLPLSSASRSAELEPAVESHPDLSQRHALDATEKADVLHKRQAAAPHKSAPNVRTPLTLTQLLDAGGKSALSNLARLARVGSDALAKAEPHRVLLPLLFCFLPAALILLAMTAPLWSRRAREHSPLAAAALLDSQKQPVSYVQQPKQFSGDPSDMAWRARVTQERPTVPIQSAEERMQAEPDMFSSSMMQGAMALFGDFGRQGATQAAMPISPSQGESDTLCPQMVIQDPTGAQFMLDGLFAPYEQKGFAEVHRNNSDMRETEVLNVYLGEGKADGGIIVEWPVGRTPVCFMGTSTAVNRQGLPPPRDRFVTIVPCFHQPFRANMPPFAIVQAFNGGYVVKRCGTDKVLLRVITGGHNIDYANIVDTGGRLIASMSLRGQSMKNRRVISMAQGVDAVLVVCAVIASTKLA